jgi:BirA family biotin operon repressor/biotin-[acetyl-CoA-carboxylase] ligase
MVVIADEQKSGRGRFGRLWISPPGVNLYFSVILSPPFHLEDSPLLTLAAAAAVASAVREQSGMNAEIKWPNDILINGKKTGGILVEMKSRGSSTHHIILGVGLNVNMQKVDLPEDLKDISTSLTIEKGTDIDRCSLLNEILLNLEKRYKTLLQGEKRALINEWLQLNCTTGNRVSVRNQDRTIAGMAEGINDDGELLVRLSDGELETVHAGDVTIEK